MAKKRGISYAQIRVMAGSWYAKDPDMTLKTLSQTTGVSEQTLVTWKREDKWEDERKLFQESPITIERELLKEMRSISEGNEPKIKADALSKVKSALALIQRDVNPQIVFAVLQRLDKFIADHHPEAIDSRLEIHKEFLRDIVENYNDNGSSKVIFIKN